MSQLGFERARRGALISLPLAGLLLASAAGAQNPPKAPAPPTAPAGPARIVSHEVTISRTAAMLKLELSDGRTLQLGLDGGEAELQGLGAPGLVKLGAAPRGSELDQSWRELLENVIDADEAELPELLRDWSYDEGPGKSLDQALDGAVSGIEVAPTAPAPISDSLMKLQEKIAQLEAQKAEAEAERAAAENIRENLQHRRGNWSGWNGGPFRHLWRGISGVFSVLLMYVVLFGIGLATIVFGGRKYIEGVADTARNATMRSFLVGIAGAFLTLPAFVLGIIALAISIVGIPALLLWVPLFPLAVLAAGVLGYLAVAHASGEALAERRLYGGEWFQRGNSYYFLITGLGLLLALYLASSVVTMAGPWLGFISGLLKFFAVMTTWAAFSIGFGAVLLSRAGTRPIRAGGRPAEPDLFTDTEEASV
ncbi:MAG: hypothetical protein FIB01_10420 [Gemmatimonadetes bacterium]|nr:hypothetical protein [Gemmatimonadota bacterium]